jgi:polynucleotide 5'-hydroxyl-kinase GRC3/NOL9
VPDDWADAIEQIFRGSLHRLNVLGPTDAGKSSFCSALLIDAARRARRVVLLDADVGQKVVGPPACVTLGRWDGALKLSSLAFVGTTDPLRGWRALLEGARRMIAETIQAVDLTLVNTDGLLTGPGVRLKRALLDVVEPHGVVILGSSISGTSPLNGIGPEGSALFPLTLSPHARRKGEGERRRARQEAFRRYFEGGVTWSLPIEATDDWSNLKGAFEPGRLVGVRDLEEKDRGLGVIRRHDSEAIEVLTPVDLEKAASLYPGHLIIDETFRETPGQGVASRAGSPVRMAAELKWSATPRVEWSSES